jgi:thiamine-phosphate pyrophosphorylase
MFLSPEPSVERLPARGLYAITPEHLRGAELYAAVEAALRGGARLLQYRAKSCAAAQRAQEASVLRTLCERYRVHFLINDDLDLAAQLQVGVHLGESDHAIADARERLGSGAIIGASCYDSLVLAQRAVHAGASYIAFGAFFPSRSKTTQRQAELSHLRKAQVFGTPIVAIGGIRPENAAELVRAGANYLAVIDALFADPSETQTQAERFQKLLQSNPAT